MTLEQLKAMKEMLEKNNEQLKKDLAAITEEQNKSRENLIDEFVKMVNQAKEILGLINEEKYFSHWLNYMCKEINYDLLKLEIRYSWKEYHPYLIFHNGNSYHSIMIIDFSDKSPFTRESEFDKSDKSLNLILSNKNFIFSQIQEFVADVLKSYNEHQVQINKAAIETLANTKGIIGD